MQIYIFFPNGHYVCDKIFMKKLCFAIWSLQIRDYTVGNLPAYSKNGTDTTSRGVPINTNLQVFVTPT